jgi:uncharacterized protein (DUF58 family)
MTTARSYFAPYKNIDDPPLFRSALLRFIWRIYTQRLTRAGQWFFWPSGVFAAYASASLQLQGYHPFAYVLGLWAVAWGALILFKPRVKLTARHADRVCAGEALPVDIEVEQLARLGADQYVLPHNLPRGVGCTPENGAPLPALRRSQSARVRLSLNCYKRGVYRLAGYRVESDFPSMLLTASRRFEEQRPLIVYPKFTRLSRLALPTGRRYHPGGVALASTLGESFEFIGNRD